MTQRCPLSAPVGSGVYFVFGSYWKRDLVPFFLNQLREDSLDFDVLGCILKLNDGAITAPENSLIGAF